MKPTPRVFRRLQHKFGDAPDVILAGCAVCDYNGIVELKITSNEQSSSILDLKGHRGIYPAITEVAKVTVAALTLDALMAEKGLASADFNILNIDIQGAELLGLKGAENTLTDIEAVNTEVNFDELYEGGVLIHKLDDFLALRGFKRVAITTPFHHAWGNAFYVRA